MRTALVETPIDIAAITAEVGRSSNGATLVFIGTVRDLNDGVQRVPDVVIANAFGFASAEFYQARDEERPSVQVQLK